MDYFDDVMKDADSLAMTPFGRTIASYITADNAVTENVAMSVGEVTETEDLLDNGGRARVKRRNFCVLRDATNDDFPGVDAVSLKGSFVIDGETWSVESIAARTEYETAGTLTITSYISAAPRGYQRNR